MDTPAAAPPTLRRRRDGWTPERQAGFVAALGHGATIAAAAAAVGMSRQSAYRLRRRAPAVAAHWGEPVCAATEDELDDAVEQGLAVRAAAEGDAEAIFRGGADLWFLRHLRDELRRAKRRAAAARRIAAKNRVVS